MATEREASTASPGGHSDAPAADAPVVLAARDLRKRYGELEAVKGVSFEIHEGETYGLLGPNGAGKTTTISMVCGLLTRDAGEVTLDGQAIDVGAVAAKAGIGYVPQELAIYPDLTARENLEFFGRLYDLGGAQLKARTSEVLELIGLDRAGEGPHVHVQRRHAAPAQHRHRAAPPAAAAAPRRAHGGRRPAEPQRDPGVRRRAGPAGHGDPVHDPLHGGGRAPLHRIGIIDGGEIRAEGTRKELVALIGQRDEVRLTLTGDVMAAARAAGHVRGVASAAAKGDEVEVLTADAGRVLPRLLDAVEGAGAHVRGVEIVQPNLEAVFLHLTGRALRDAE